MTDISVSAQVECADGPCGESGTIIVSPHTGNVTHVVVDDQITSPSVLRLVPFAEIEGTTHSQIRLRCTKEELAGFEPFLKTHYVEKREAAVAEYAVNGQFHMVPRASASQVYYEEEQVERIPPGELAVRRGMHVKATDGVVGKVDELLVEPDTGHVTHLVLLKGHLWGKVDVMVPVSEINFADVDTVHLKLDKSSIKDLPSVPYKRH
jgi:sporulation protein YlmC with PRC-barrel domain